MFKIKKRFLLAYLDAFKIARCSYGTPKTISGALSSTSKIVDRQELWQRYQKAKEMASCSLEMSKVSPHGVFTNNQLDLKQIGVYGFDYDYTLAVYKKDLNTLIYELALQRLIDDFKYPAALADIPYDPDFAIRGLHYDVEQGLFMKLDAFLMIQSETVYKGKSPLSNRQVDEIYSGHYIPADYVAGPDQKNERLKQMLDLFALPEGGLLANIIQFFCDNKIDFDSDSLFRDVAVAIQSVHSSGDMYKAVMNNLEKYVHYMVGLRTFFERLIAEKKIVFLVTNSPFVFINAGLRYLIGDDWRDYFHFIVVKARKPKFFKEFRRPFRVYNEETNRLSYEKVNILKRGVIYAEGNLNEFLLRSQLGDEGVLYFGDHVYSDLAEPMLKLGWRTGAIVPELKREIQIQNSPAYCKQCKWLSTLTWLIEHYQDDASASSETHEVLEAWKTERRKLRTDLKNVFNPQFGSIFRTYHSPTYFSRRLMRLADIYTCRLTNLLGVRLDHTFYPARYALPHETHFSLPDLTTTV